MQGPLSYTPLVAARRYLTRLDQARCTRLDAAGQTQVPTGWTTPDLAGRGLSGQQATSVVPVSSSRSKVKLVH